MSKIHMAGSDCLRSGAYTQTKHNLKSTTDPNKVTCKFCQAHIYVKDLEDNTPMVLAIVGSRGFSDYDLMQQSLFDIQWRVQKVVSGDAKGADLLGKRWARERGIEYKAFLPDWGNHGKAAGPIRNELIIKESTHVVAFWDGESRGTKSSIDLARKYRRRLRIIRYSLQK